MRCQITYRLIVAFAIVILFARCEAVGQETVRFIVERKYEKRAASEQVTVLLDYNEVVGRTKLKKQGITVTDLNFGKPVNSQLADTNGDGKADKIVLKLEFASNEPIFSYILTPSSSKAEVIQFQGSTDNRLQVTYLTKVNNKEARNWPNTIIESTKKFYPNPYSIALYGPERWNYEYGFFLTGVWKQGKLTGKQAYLDYVKTWVDNFVMADGKLNKEQYKPEEFKLDDILPGRNLIFLYEETKDEHYKIAATQLAEQLVNQPKTSEGGYWHKEIYPYQMWLDGIYMADIFSMQYAQAFAKPEFLEEAIKQIKLIAKHTTDSATGLLYHGWDESKNKVWAHPVKGTSPEFWARAIGWYAMALVECLEYVPQNHPDRTMLIDLLQKVTAAVAAQRDGNSKLWYQVIDKGNQPGNWIETSSSAMFTYVFAKAAGKGWIDKSFLNLAKESFQSLVSNYVFFDASGKLYLDQTVKIGTLNPKGSKGDYDYYITTERRINDYKGLAALLYASLELQPKN